MNDKMRLFFIWLLISIVVPTFSQSGKEGIETIKTHIDYINEYSELEVITLTNSEFLDDIPDNGAQIIGYFKDDVLFKIIEWFGASYGILTTEYYLKDSQLVYVYEKENSYLQMIDSLNGFVGFNFSETRLNYEAEYYYSNGIIIQNNLKGERLYKSNDSEGFFMRCFTHKKLLEIKRNDNEVNQIDVELKKCLNLRENYTTAGMVKCTNLAIKKWDEELNVKYQELLGLMTEDQKIILKESQRKWIEFRDKEIDLINRFYSDLQGTMWIPISAMKQVELIKSRVLIIEDYISTLTLDDD